MGGYSPIVKTTYVIDATQKQMVQKRDMVTAKYAHSLCTHQDMIFSIGGDSGPKYLANCEVYETKDNIWKVLPNMVTPRRYCAAVAFGKQWIYAIAGWNDSNLNSVERLPISGNTNWSNVNMQPTFFARSCVHGI